MKKKQTFHISNWVEKCMLNFFQKAYAGAKEGNFFSGHSQKVREGDFFKVITVTIKNKSVKYEESTKK